MKSSTNENDNSNKYEIEQIKKFGAINNLGMIDLDKQWDNIR